MLALAAQVAISNPRATHTVAPPDDVLMCGSLQIHRQFQHAIEHCNAALSANPNNADTLSNRGSANLALDCLEQVLTDFGQAIDLRPDDASSYFNRGLAHAAAEQHERAVADYTQALELMPTLAIAHNNWGLAYEKLGDRDKAIADFRAAFAMAPNLKMIENNLRRLGIAP
ncbi:MAG: tetratricopeptide repeat protein [Hyphomicrobiaceae bacterium]